MVQEIGEYKYKELCQIMNDKERSGDSKRAQLKRWEQFFEWEKPKPQIYRVTNIYETPKWKSNNHGGVRQGAGAKEKNQYYFRYLFNSFLYREWQRNEYHVQAQWSVAYFTNKQIGEYFGFFSSDFYAALKDKRIDKSVFKKVQSKIQEKIKSWIVDKIKKLEDVELSEGIIAYKKNRTFEYRDDFLEDWKKYQKEYLKLNKTSIHKIINNDKWEEMIQYISKYFPGYEKVIKCHKVSFGLKNCTSYELDECEEYRLHYNCQIAREIYKFFLEKERKSYDETNELAQLFNYDDDFSIPLFDEESVMYPYKVLIDNYIVINEEITLDNYILQQQENTFANNKILS